jgi:hypothetical protein
LHRGSQRQHSPTQLMLLHLGISLRAADRFAARSATAAEY